MSEAKRIVTFRDRLIGFGLEHAKYFEPFAPFGISYYLKGELKQYRQKGLLSIYKVRVKRLGRWHYRIQLDLDFTPWQVAFILTELSKRLHGLGRR